MLWGFVPPWAAPFRRQRRTLTQLYANPSTVSQVL